MSYTIDERNPERQRLLAEILNPSTGDVLARLPAMRGAKVLDLGCGRGYTTRYLAKVLEPAVCLGLEYDAALVEYARTRPENPPGVQFQHGDATALPFPDASFDVVFCRYLLIHMTDPGKVVSEMLRVVRPGGFAVAFEADITPELSHPPCAGLVSIQKAWHGLFANPSVGRRLVHYFRAAGASAIQAGALLLLEHGANSSMKRLYRLSAEATGPEAQARGVLTGAEVREMIESLTRLEEDASSVLIKFPDVWTIATR